MDAETKALVEELQGRSCSIDLNLSAARVITAQAAQIADQEAEVDRWHSAYEMAFNQAMRNGENLANARAQIEELVGALRARLFARGQNSQEHEDAADRLIAATLSRVKPEGK